MRDKEANVISISRHATKYSCAPDTSGSVYKVLFRGALERQGSCRRLIAIVSEVNLGL